MATISYASEDDFVSSAFRGGQFATNNFMKAIVDVNRNLVNTFSTIGGEALQYVKSGFNAAKEFLVNTELRNLKSNMQQSSNAWQGEGIKRLTTLEELQTANLTMQHFLMANPRLREMWQKNIVDGYSTTYISEEPDAIGELQLLYRQVMSGAVVNEDGKDVLKTYVESAGKEPLHPVDRLLVRLSWKAMEDILDNTNEDPTSIFCATL